MRAIAVLASWLTAGNILCYAQFLPDLQARTPAEFDAYLDVLEAPGVEGGEAFLREFPDSALRLPVWELLVKARRAEGNAAAAIRAARSGLALAPEYAPLLVELADLLANGAVGWEAAETPARSALAVLERVKAPQRVGPTEWTAAVQTLAARACAALGLVQFKRNDVAGAIRQFEAAVRQSPAGDATLRYRLGRLYAVAGRTREARVELAEAARAGSAELRALARQALAGLPE
jgi:tetratricopeptide (TPR) repeat protein